MERKYFKSVVKCRNLRRTRQYFLISYSLIQNVFEMKNLSNRARISEVSAATGRMISAYKTASLDADARLGAMFAQLEVLSGSLSQAINPSKALSELEAKDALRDERLRSLHFALKTFLPFPDEKVGKATEAMKEVFDKYGLSMTKENYAVQTGLLRSMLEDYSTPEMQEAISLVPGCSTIMEGIKAAQAEFEVARVTYEKVKGEEEGKANATAMKKQVLKLLNGILLPYIDVLSDWDQGSFTAFAGTIGKIVSNTNDSVSMRANKAVPVEE